MLKNLRTSFMNGSIRIFYQNTIHKCFHKLLTLCKKNYWELSRNMIKYTFSSVAQTQCKLRIDIFSFKLCSNLQDQISLPFLLKTSSKMYLFLTRNWPECTYFCLFWCTYTKDNSRNTTVHFIWLRRLPGANFFRIFPILPVAAARGSLTRVSRLQGQI